MLVSHMSCELFVSHGSGLLTGAFFTMVFEFFPKKIINSSVRINVLGGWFVFLKINSISKVKQTGGVVVASALYFVWSKAESLGLLAAIPLTVTEETGVN